MPAEARRPKAATVRAWLSIQSFCSTEVEPARKETAAIRQWSFTAAIISGFIWL